MHENFFDAVDIDKKNMLILKIIILNLPFKISIFNIYFNF